MVAAFFHQPFGGAGCSTDAHRLGIGKPIEVYLAGILHMITSRIYSLAFVKKHFSVAAFPSAHKDYHIVLGCEARDVGHAVGHLSANGVETAERGRRADVRLNVLDDAVELV